MGPGSPAMAPRPLATPVPPMVVMLPCGSIRRMRAPIVSAMKMLPAASAMMPRGPLRWAALAGPPSPDESPWSVVLPVVDVAAWLAALTSPAIVRMIPSGVILRIRLLSVSETRIVPSASTNIPLGLFRLALRAGPPSPPKRLDWVVPATVLTTSGLAFRSIDRIMLCDVSQKYRTSLTIIICFGSWMPALAAGTLSPGGVVLRPVPAKVVIVPDGSIRRRRLFWLSEM